MELFKSGNPRTELANRVVAYFVFTSIFITIRVLLLGSAPSHTLLQFMFSVLPDVSLLALAVGTVSVVRKRGGLSWADLTLPDRLLLAFIVTNIILGTLLAGDLKLSLYAIRLTFIPMLMYFVARFGLNGSTREMEALLARIFDWYAFVAVISLAFYFALPDIITYMTLRSGGWETWFHIKRMGSVFYTPVVTGAFMGAASLFSFYRIIGDGSPRRHLVFLLFWSCLFLTVSRGSIIGFLIGQLALAWTYRRWKAYLKALAGMGLACVLLGVFNRDISKMFFFIASSTTSTLSHTIADMAKENKAPEDIARVNFWIASFHDFRENPMGYGLGKAGHIAWRFRSRGEKRVAIYSTDGWYLKLGNETGIWGLLSYFCFAVVHFFRSLRHHRLHRNNMFGFVLLAYFAVIGLHNLASNVLDFYSYNSLYWLMIGVSQNISGTREHERN